MGIAVLWAGESAALSCTVTHPALIGIKLPPPIPIDTLFFRPMLEWDHRISPNGEKLLWLAIEDGVAAVHARALTGGSTHVFHAGRPLSWAYWASDSRHIVGWWDVGGDENYQPIVFDSENPSAPPRELFTEPGIRVYLHQSFPGRSPQYLIRHNQRDRGTLDLYHLDLLSGRQTLMAQNPGDVESWITDQDGTAIARVRRLADYRWTLESAEDGGWRSLLNGEPDERIQIKGHPPVGLRFAWGLSNRGRDRTAFVRLDLQSGKEMVAYEHPRVDVSGLWVDELIYAPLVAWAWPDRFDARFLDPALGQDLALIAEAEPYAFDLLSSSDDKSFYTVSIDADNRGPSIYLLDRTLRKAALLAESAVSQYAASLAPMRPISYRARDGLTIHAYLSVPPGTAGRRLPTILRVHGGPFSRDVWGYDALDQFFTNRGYAVLRVNYRGSTGYGRAFIEAARGEFGRKMQDDLIDGVNWLIGEGVADPAKIAIYGKSFGGYAALAALAFTPEVFAAGVDIAGFADLQALFEGGPEYWQLQLPYWRRFVGDPAKVEDRADMTERSPINYVDRITRPLLVAHGAQDVRVLREQAEQLVSALEKKGLDVEYLRFEDEGHSIQHGHNRRVLARATEEFLARHLGGRSCS